MTNFEPNIKVNNQGIERATSSKYQGILVVDEKLNWNGHIKKIYNKLTPMYYTGAEII